MWFNIDGELLTKDPVEFSILHKSIEVFTCTNYISYPVEYDNFL